MRTLLFALALTALASAAPAQTPLTANVDVAKGGVLNDGDAILIPTVLLQIPADGSLFIANQGGGGTAQAKAKYVVEGFTKEMLQNIALEAQQDLAARFKAAGFTVKTWDDIKDNPEVAKWDLMKPDKDYGMATDGDPGVTYLVVTPSDAQSLKSGVTGPVWKFRGIAKEQKYVVIVPQFWFTAPQVWGEKESGYKRVSAKVNVAPGMNLHGAFAWILNPKGGGGSVKLKDGLINLTENAGALVEIDSKSSNLGGGGTVGLTGTALGAGKIGRKSASYVLTVNPDEYTAGALRGIRAFNQAIVDAAVKEKGK